MKKWHQLVCAMSVGVFVLGGAMVQPALAQPDDMQPGSFLVYPLFDIKSGVDGLTRNQTRIRITNNGSASRDVHVTAICPGKTVKNDGILDAHCAATDRKFTITPHMTVVLDVGTPSVPKASPAGDTYEYGLPVDADCDEGYVLAYAQNPPDADGVASAVSSNTLYGDYQIIYNPGSGGDTTVEAAPAIAIQSVRDVGTVLGIRRGNGLLDLSFGLPVAGQTTADYTPVPTYLLGDFAAIGGNLSPGPVGFTETDTRIVLLVLDVFADASNKLARAGIFTWDAKENGPYSTSREFYCWTRFGLGDSQGQFFTKQLAGVLDADYGSFRIILSGGGLETDYNPAGFGAIEEVSNLGGTRGNTIRNMHHTVGNKSTFIRVDALVP